MIKLIEEDRQRQQQKEIDRKKSLRKETKPSILTKFAISSDVKFRLRTSGLELTISVWNKSQNYILPNRHKFDQKIFQFRIGHISFIFNFLFIFAIEWQIVPRRYQFKKIKCQEAHRRCSLDSNLGPQDVRCRDFQWGMPPIQSMLIEY